MTTIHQGEIHLAFAGPPIADGIGTDPNFIGRVLPAFAGLVASLCIDPDAETAENDITPLMLARTNMGSCILRMQESDRLTPHGLTRFQEVIESFAESEREDTVEALNGITGQSFNGLKKFLSANASAETTFSVEHNNNSIQMDELEQIKDALKLLRGLRKLEVKEEGVTVNFAGYLPQQRKAEFTRDGKSGITVARVNPKAHGFDDLIQRIEEPRVISLVTRQTGDSRPSITILTVE